MDQGIIMASFRKGAQWMCHCSKQETVEEDSGQGYDK